MQKILFYAIPILFILIAGSAIAAGSLDRALDSLGDLHLAETYNNHYQLIDAILSFFIFISVCKVAFGEKFKDSNVPTIMGIILAIGMILFEYNSKFKLARVLLIVAVIALVWWIIRKAGSIGTGTKT